MVTYRVLSRWCSHPRCRGTRTQQKVRIKNGLDDRVTAVHADLSTGHETRGIRGKEDDSALAECQ